MHRDCSGHTSAKRGIEHKATSLSQKLSPTESQWGYEPLLRVSPMPSNRWSTKNKLHGIFKGPLSHSVLSGHFVLNLVNTYVFLFCIFGGFLCLRLCMSLCLYVSLMRFLFLFSSICLFWIIRFVCLFLMYLVIEIGFYFSSPSWPETYCVL